MHAIEAIKKGFAVTNRNPRLVILLFIFSLIYDPISTHLEKFTTQTIEARIISLLLAIVLFLVWAFIQGGSLGIIRDYIKTGKVGVVNFMRYGLKYYLRFILWYLAIAGAGIIVYAIALLISMLLAITLLGVFSMIIAAIIVGIGLYKIFLLAVFSPYEIVCEDESIMQALVGSEDIAGRSVGKILFLLAVIVLIGLGWIELLKLMPSNNRIIVTILESVFNGYFWVVIQASFMALYLSLTTETVS